MEAKRMTHKERGQDSFSIRRDCRNGQTLLLIVLFLLVLMGIAALTLDFGFVLLSRRTMQTAVNTGSLEGARDTDGMGRQDARRVMRNVFDDDLDPTENQTTLGAGPDHSLVQLDSNDRKRLGLGTGMCDLLDNRHEFVYRPDPQLNESNQPHGDLVAGSLTDDDPDEFCEHTEPEDYNRSDFVADDSGEAFLARIRRTPERDEVTNPLDRVDNVSSSGSGSPLLVGRLLPFIPQDADTFDIRCDGVTIRATAIAVNQPIVSVGSAVHDKLYSAIPFARHASTGLVHEIADTALRLGTPVTIQAVAAPTTTGYVAVVDDFNGADYVVGFQLHKQTTDDHRRHNASPRLHDAYASLDLLAPELRQAVLERHRDLADSTLARVPVLVRSVR